MAVETLTANTLVADSGTVLSFSGGTFDIGDLKDGNQSTGLTIGSNDAFIDFSISNLVASSIVEALFNVTVVTNGVNEKNLIVITALDQTTNFFLNPSGTGTFTIDITSLGANRIAKEVGGSDWQFVRGDKKVESAISKAFNRCKTSDGAPVNEDKWNPSDIWMVKDKDAVVRELDKENILNIVSQDDIMRYYLGFDYIPNKLYLSPLRKEHNPSFAIYYTS